MPTTLDKYLSGVNSGSSTGVSHRGTTLDKYLGKDSVSKIEEARKRIAEQDAIYKKNQVLKSANDNIQKNLDEYNANADGILGGINRFFGKGVAQPVLLGDSQEVIAQKNAPQPTFGQNIKDMVTGNTTQSAYDIFHQNEADKMTLDNIKKNNEVIKHLSETNKTEQDPSRKIQREKSIQYLLESNKKQADGAGGELKNKTNLQLSGQALGTALELTPFLGAGSLGVRTGEAVIGAGAKMIGKKVATRVLEGAGKNLAKEAAKEGATFGAATGLSGGLQQENPTLKSIAIETAKGGIFGGTLGGILGFIGTKLGSKSAKLEKAIEDGIITPQSAEELLANGGIKEVEKAIDTPTVKTNSPNEIKSAVEDLRTYMSNPVTGIKKESVSTLSRENITDGVKFDENGNTTLYRVGDITDGKPQSYSITKKFDAQVPVSVNKSDIVVNTNSPKLRELFKSTYPETDPTFGNPVLSDNLKGLDHWNNQEAEIIAISRKETPTVVKSQSHLLQEAVRTPKVASDINRKLAESGFKSLPENELAKFDSITKEKAINDVASLIENNYTKAVKMVTGHEPIPAGIEKQVLFNAVEARAMKEGDHELLRLMARSDSPIAIERAYLAQKLGSAGYNTNSNSVISHLQELTRAKIEMVNKKFGGALKAKNVIKSEITKAGASLKSISKKTMPTMEDLNKLITDISC